MAERRVRISAFEREDAQPQQRTSSTMGDYDDRDLFDSRVAYWMPPSPSILTDGGGELIENADKYEPLQVDFRCACFKLTNISTVDFTTIIKFVIVFEWNDPRLCGMPITTNDLPGDLWGPDVVLENANNDCEVIYDSFSLLDSLTGRLKRTVTFHGPVYNPMSLKGFPFDSDELEMKFISISNWRTLDGSRFGNDPVKQVYKLEPILDKKGVDFFFLGWGGKVNEFTILGWSHKVDNSIHEPSKPIIFKFDIHLARKAQFYYLKILVPLWLIVLTSLAVYGIETDDLQGRLEVLVTLLLSTIAFLYIIQESIPKMSHLTVIDKVVLASLVSLVLAVLFSFLISILPNPTTLNWILALVNQLMYWVTNLILIVPSHYRWKKYIAEMEEKQAARQLTSSMSLRPELHCNRGSIRLTDSQILRQIRRTRTLRSYSLTAKMDMQGDYESESNKMLGFNRTAALLKKKKEALQHIEESKSQKENASDQEHLCRKDEVDPKSSDSSDKDNDDTSGRKSFNTDESTRSGSCNISYRPTPSVKSVNGSG